MDVLRKLFALGLVGFALLCVAAWAAWFNPDFGDLYRQFLPFLADAFPGDPMMTPVGVGLGAFVVAFLVWPPERRE